MRRGNRHLVGVVLGGRSGGSRDATMRNLLAENLEKAATKRTVAAISERNAADGAVDVAEAGAASRPAETAQSGSTVASAEPGPAAMPTTRSIAPAKPSLMAAAAAALPPPAKVEQNKFEPQAKPEPAPLTSGVIQSQSISAIPGSAEPMKPVKVKTVQVKAGPMKLASATGSQPVAPPVTNAILARPEVAETSSAVVANAAEARAEAARDALRAAMPQQPAGHGTGHGVLGVLPASSLTQAPPQAAPHTQAMAYADPAPRAQPQAMQQNDAAKPAAPAVVRTGWIVQVGALESEAKQRIDLARTKASSLLGKADPFTETIVSKDNKTLYRARFAGLDRDSAEAVCKALKRADISCMTVRN
jgi:D-alanyl-D-alanine carboxypeptidase